MYKRSRLMFSIGIGMMVFSILKLIFGRDLSFIPFAIVSLICGGVGLYLAMCEMQEFKRALREGHCKLEFNLLDGEAVVREIPDDWFITGEPGEWYKIQRRKSNGKKDR